MALTTSIMRGGVNNHETTSEEANGVYTDFVSEGVLGTIANTSGVAPATGAYAVNAQGTPDMTVAVTAGTAYVTATPSTQGSQTFRVVSSAEEDVTISANSSGSTKYDWVYLKLDATLLNAPNVAGTDAATLVTSRSSSISTDDGTPPTYSILLAIVTVSNGAATITNGNIKDLRERTSIGASTTDSTGWLSLGATPGTVTALGNRSYTLLFDNTDLTDTVSEGMRLRTTRTVSAPTQCADLEASSSQYFSKTSPAGMTFTTTFTYSAWVKLESYALGGIMGRRNGVTEGSSFRVNADGTVTIIGLRIAGNNKFITSYQSLPLNKWVHVAACLDMTAGDTSAQKIWFDGVEVPRSYTLNGTATAIVQGTTALTVGAEYSDGTNKFDGKVAQASVHSACLSDAQIKALMSQTIDSSSPSIVSGFTLNGVLTDVSANANDLTASGGALATATDTPFGNYLGGTLDYAIITKKAFSTNTTLTVQVPEGCTIPTSGGVSAVAYSTQAVPYGFPRSSDRWSILMMNKTNSTQASPVASTVYNLGSEYLTIPVGSWNVEYSVLARIVNGTNQNDVNVTLSTGNNSTSDIYWTTRGLIATSATGLQTQLTRAGFITQSSATPYYLNTYTTVASANPMDNRGDISPTLITAIPAYL